MFLQFFGGLLNDNGPFGLISLSYIYFIYIYIYIYIQNHQPLYKVHMFNWLVTQIANQPIIWQKRNAFRHLDVVKTTC